MAAHISYLSVEAHIRNMPLLQPQRQLSAKMLLEAEAQSQMFRLPDTVNLTKTAQQKTAIILTTYSARLKNLIITLLRPGYALIVLLFCLLTTTTAIETISYSSQDTTLLAAHLNTTPQIIQPPHLIASTTAVTLNFVADLSNHLSIPQDQAMSQLAYATFLLKNTGGQPVMWEFNRTRSAIFHPYDTIELSTQPSHGILKSNEYSSVLVIVSGISSAQLSFNEMNDFAHIVFTSNGGDISLQASLKMPTTVAPVSSIARSSFSASSTRNPLPLSTHSDYLLRKQIA